MFVNFFHELKSAGLPVSLREYLTLMEALSVDLAEKRVESTTLLLQAGRVTTRDLLDSQDALLGAQNSLTAALVDFAIAKLSFFRDVGILQVKPDGMWDPATVEMQSDSPDLPTPSETPTERESL